MGHITRNSFHSASEAINHSLFPIFVVLHLRFHHPLNETTPCRHQQAMRLSQIITIVCCYIIFLVSATSSSIEAATDEQPSARSVNSSDVSMNSDSIHVTAAYPATQISSSLLTSPSVSPRANRTVSVTPASSHWRAILQLVR